MCWGNFHSLQLIWPSKVWSKQNFQASMIDLYSPCKIFYWHNIHMSLCPNVGRNGLKRLPFFQSSSIWQHDPTSSIGHLGRIPTAEPKRRGWRRDWRTSLTAFEWRPNGRTLHRGPEGIATRTGNRTGERTHEGTAKGHDWSNPEWNGPWVFRVSRVTWSGYSQLAWNMARAIGDVLEIGAKRQHHPEDI